MVWLSRNNPMRFAIVSDLHYGYRDYEYKGVYRKLSSQSRRLLTDAVNDLRTNHHPDFIVNLGDIIEDEARDLDLKKIAECRAILDTAGCPIYHISGNHEQWGLSQSEITSSLGLDNLFYKITHDRLDFYFLFSHNHPKGDPITIDQEQIEWLRTSLQDSSREALIFVHHPLTDMDLTGNFWFENAEAWALIYNRAEVRTLLESTSKIRAVFNGHMHWHHQQTINKIPYITLQSMIENYNGTGIPAGCYAVIDITPDTLHVQIFGTDHKEYKISSSKEV